jgi:hypothetical protein
MPTTDKPRVDDLVPGQSNAPAAAYYAFLAMKQDLALSMLREDALRDLAGELVENVFIKLERSSQCFLTVHEYFKHTAMSAFSQDFRSYVAGLVTVAWFPSEGTGSAR